MKPPESGHQLTWKYPAILQNMEQVCSAVTQILEKRSIERKDQFAVELLLREALNNAIMHGCQQKPHLFFSGNLTISDRDVTIQVSDDGPGFDWLKETEILHRDADESGRGLQIYANYASTTKFNAAGNCVTLTRALTRTAP